MNKEFVENFMKNKKELFKEIYNEGVIYNEGIVKLTLKAILPEYDKREYDYPDYNNIHVIDDGDYQGTQLFIIPNLGYQPHDYHYIFLAYGSCSLCDTMQAIADNDDKIERAKNYMKTALHIVQALKPL